MSDQLLKFNKQFFVDFWRLLKPFWVSDEKKMAYLLLTLCLIGIVVEIRAGVAINAFNKDFFDALQHFNRSALNTALWHFMVLLAVQVLAVGYAVYFNGLLTIRWRKWLTEIYIQKWLSNRNYYHMQLQGSQLDNPDQRISEDLADFVSSTLGIFLVLVQAILSLSSFGYILWQLSGNLPISIAGMHIVIPGYLCLSAMCYAVLGTWITTRIGKTLASLDYQQQRFNADFRFSLIRLREASEQVALYRGEQAESEKLRHLFTPIVNNFYIINILNRRLTFFTNGYNTVSYVAGLIMAIPLYFQRKLQLGNLMQATGAIYTVIATFSILIKHYSDIAELRAIVHRLAEFNKFMHTQNISTELDILASQSNHDVITVKNLKLSLPQGDTLLEDIDFTLPAGSKVLLNGASGVGKSTLVKALAGLWPYGSGKIYLPKNAKLFFMPQKPYLPPGSLKEVLSYPSGVNALGEQLEELLVLCGLSKFVDKLEESKSWAQELSLGEQQKIAFVRMLIQKPDIAFLDEATSALDEAAEKQLYQLIHEQLPTTTVISVGHRSSLQQFHTLQVMLNVDGAAAMRSLNLAAV
jgi:putative ATP-binding cassette transporter